MKDKDVAFGLLLVAALCVGCFIASLWQGQLQYAAISLILVFIFATIATIFHYKNVEESGTSRSGSEAPLHVTRPAEPAYYQSPTPTYIYQMDACAGEQRTAGSSAGLSTRAVLAAEKSFAAFLAQPAFWLGVTTFALALISFFGGMTGMWTTWKAMHAAGAFALVSAGFFTSAYQKWATGKEFVAKHFVVIWLSMSVVGFLTTLVHQNWPTAVLLLGFFLSGVAATITLLGKWKEVASFLGTWLFAKGKISVFIWLFLLMLGLLMSFSPAILAGKAVTSTTAALGTLFAAGFWLLIPIGILAIWKKL